MIKAKSIFFISFLFFFIIPVSISEATDSDGMDFSMNVIQPENQINNSVKYLDLLVSPSQEQVIEVVVTNYGNDTKQIQVTPTNAVTNIKGNIDYNKRPDDYIYDKSLKIPLTSLISKKQTVEVGPNETKKLLFNLKAPDQKFDGIILGGLVADLVEEKDKVEDKNDDATFKNKFQVITGVILRSSENDHFSPVIKLGKISPSLYSYRTAVTANLQNETPILLKNVTVEANVTKINSDKILKTEKRTDVEFAPNSNFDFPIMWNNEPLEPGKYVLHIKVEANGKPFEFTENFGITKEESYTINEQAIELETMNDPTIWIAVFLVSIIGVCAFIWLIFRKKQKKEKKHTKHKNKHKSKHNR